MKRSAFTLIEFLVAFFVLCLIAAILFPIFSRAREPRTKSSCQSNLKQVVLGFKQYTQDYDEFFPIVFHHPASMDSSSCTDTCGYGWGDALQPYLKSTQIFQCPSEPKVPAGLPRPWHAGYTDYYTNKRLSGAEEANVKYPANTLILGEGNDGIDIDDARYSHSSVPQKWLAGKSSPATRHLDGANYAFVDGHVKWLDTANVPGVKPSDGKVFTFRMK